jgi:hypothetical protein
MLTTGRVYAHYDELIRSIERWVEQKWPRVFGCDDAQVRQRVVQRIVELTSDEYVQQIIDRDGELPGEMVHAGGLRVQQKIGRVSVSLRIWLRELGYTFAVWAHFLLPLITSLFKKAPIQTSPATLLMEGPGGIENSDERFVQFCRSGPIGVLASARCIIVRAARPRFPSGSILEYADYTLNSLVQMMNRADRASLLLRHLAAPFHLVASLLRSPLTILLCRDLALIPAVRLLDEKGVIEAIVITTSFFTGQPLWMKGTTRQRFKLHMIWYSQNFIPKVYAGDTERPNLPSARHMRVDVHWVWTDGFAGYLRELGQSSEMRVVGPILWYLPEPVPGLGDGIKLCLFDVTPLRDGLTVFGAIRNYYSVETITKFVSDIVALRSRIAAASGREAVILLKHKRPPEGERHDSSYLDFLDQLARSDTGFRLIDHQTNLFGLLSACDLSISVPYTSTAYVSAALGKPAIYYDPFAELIPVFERNQHVHFASGPDELCDMTAQCLGINLKPVSSGK